MKIKGFTNDYATQYVDQSVYAGNEKIFPPVSHSCFRGSTCFLQSLEFAGKFAVLKRGPISHGHRVWLVAVSFFVFKKQGFRGFVGVERAYEKEVAVFLRLGEQMRTSLFTKRKVEESKDEFKKANRRFKGIIQ